MPTEIVPDQSPLSISPNGRRVAFSIHAADATSNTYCQAIYVKDLDHSSAPRLVDSGGDYIRYSFDDLRGLVFPTGSPKVIVPVWSPDGTRIAFLKRMAGRVQAWVAEANGGIAKPATDEGFDVDEVAWTPGGLLSFSGSPDLAAQRAAIAREALTGYRFDARIVPMGGPMPYPRSPVVRRWFVLDTVSGHTRVVRDDEHLADRDGGQIHPPNAEMVVYGPPGHTAWTAPADLQTHYGPSDLFATSSDGPAKHCGDRRCRGKFAAFGWTGDGSEIWYLRRQGPANSLLALYRWRPATGQVRLLLETPDVLGNCALSRGDLICLRESSTSPRFIDRIRLRDGRSTCVVNVNPDFARFGLGRVRRLYWYNDDGLMNYGDLILPPDYRRTHRYPLVVVQYRTRGFLRGAVGDLYPIQAFAARGMAVLSIEGPPSLAETRIARGQLPSSIDGARQDIEEWSDRHNVLRSLLRGLSTAIATGAVDPARVGISGTSEGAVSTWFAIINAPGTFAAASMGSCCSDPETFLAFAGQGLRQHLQQIGYPRYLEDAPTFWKPISIARNAKAINIPLLIQVPSEEFGTAVEAFTALTETKKNAELYIFPDENHYIWQPAHRLAIYSRNVEWFCSTLDCDDKHPISSSRNAPMR